LRAQLLETQGASAAIVNIQKNFDELTNNNVALQAEIKVLSSKGRGVHLH